jgi:RimK family alpha-L-glutamate ligase
VVAWKALPSNLPLVRAWRRLGIASALLGPADAHRHLQAGDVALLRLDVRATIDGVEPGLLDVAGLARRGVCVLNRPEALVAAHDKWQTARRLQHAGFPHPATSHVASVDELRAFEPPYVLKPRFGSWGKDVRLCSSAADVDHTATLLHDRAWFKRHGVLVQELITPVGQDLRLIVAANRVVGAEERHAAPGEWRTNEALGGRVVHPPPPARACSLAVQAAGTIEVDLAGVDLLPTPNGDYVVLEINGAVDFDIADSLAGRDIYRDAASALGLLPAAAGADPASAVPASEPDTPCSTAARWVSAPLREDPDVGCPTRR